MRKQEFAFTIRQAREANNMSQQQVADAVGVSKQAVSDWENEEKPTIPKGQKLDKLYRTLDLSGNEKPKSPSIDMALRLVEKSLDTLSRELDLNRQERNNDVLRLERDKDSLTKIIHDLTATINRTALKQA